MRAKELGVVPTMKFAYSTSQQHEFHQIDLGGSDKEEVYCRWPKTVALGSFDTQ